MARFEVLGLDADRELIRSLAKRLAGDAPDSMQNSRHGTPYMAGEQPKRGGFSTHYAGRQWSAPI